MRWNLRSPMREKSNRIYLWFTLYHQIQSHHANKCEFRCCVLSINGVASKNNIVSCNYRLRVTCNSTQCECGLDKRGKAETKSNKNNNIKIMKPNSFSRTRTSAVSLVLFGWHIWIRISASHSADAWASYACLLSLSRPQFMHTFNATKITWNFNLILKSKSNHFYSNMFWCLPLNVVHYTSFAFSQPFK